MTLAAGSVLHHFLVCRDWLAERWPDHAWLDDNVPATVDIAKEKGAPGGTNSEQTRRESLRELMLARALYRCGDRDGLGEKILRDYIQDLRGHLARHAKAVLEQNESR